MKNYAKLGNIAKIYSGGTPSRTNPRYWGGDIPWVKTTQIQNGVITEKDIDEWITSEALNKSAVKMVPKGAILMAMYGQGKTRGQVAILEIDATINQACAAIIIENRADINYIYQQLLYRYASIRNLSNTGSQENLNSALIKSITFPLPDLILQKEIALILSTWDQAIEKTERLIAAKEKWLKILQQKLIFIPSQNNKQFRHCKIEDISHRIQRKSDSKEYPILMISSASGFVLQEEKYSRFMAGKSLEDYILLHRGEFAYNKGNSLRYQFGCIFLLKDYEAALVPHVYVCFKLHDDIDADYVSHVFKADYLRKQLGALVNTGIRNNGLLNISPATFMKVTVPVPQPEKQKQIASILNTAEKEIDLLKKQLDAYRRQKRGIMQKLLTGQWRVKITEERSSNG